jgi:acyl-CoA synthetase (NDP forming)
MNDLDYFFFPKSIAIIGATDDPLKFGHEITKNVIETLKYSKEGRNKRVLYLVNKKKDMIFNQPCFKNIRKLPLPPDLSIILVPSKAVLQVLRDCATIGTKAVIIITAGFGEIDEKGKEIEKQMLDITRHGGFRLIGPNCVGIINTEIPLNASFIKTPEPGKISLISQSGSVGASIIYRLSDTLKQGLHIFVNLGNAIDVQPHEMIEYLRNLSGTNTIGCYLETIKDGRSFYYEAKKTTSKKPIVVLKAGRTRQGKLSAASHTGALASDFKIFEGMTRQSRIFSVKDEISLQSALFTLAVVGNKIEKPKIGIITNAGGPAVILSDLLAESGIKLASLTKEIPTLINNLNPLVKWHNPLDLIASAREKEYQVATQLFLLEKNIDLLLVLCVVPTFLEMNPLEHARGVISAWLQMSIPRKPLIMGWLSGDIGEKARSLALENDIPYFTTIPEILIAVEALFYYSF